MKTQQLYNLIDNVRTATHIFDYGSTSMSELLSGAPCKITASKTRGKITGALFGAEKIEVTVFCPVHGEQKTTTDTHGIRPISETERRLALATLHEFIAANLNADAAEIEALS